MATADLNVINVTIEAQVDSILEGTLNPKDIRKGERSKLYCALNLKIIIATTESSLCL